MKYITQQFKKSGIQTFIETSGAYPLTGVWDWVCLSPKKTGAPLQENYLKADELKIIIHNKSDFEWAEKNAQHVSDSCKLFLQPEWSKSKEMMPMIVDYVMLQPKWNVSLQSHKYMNIP